MAWQSVYICDAHWEEETGKRSVHVVLPEGVEVVTEPCYRCGEPACIPVRRDLAGDIGAYCSVDDCGEEGIVRVSEAWFCLEHLGQGFTPVRTIQEAFRVAFPVRILDDDGGDAA